MSAWEYLAAAVAIVVLLNVMLIVFVVVLNYRYERGRHGEDPRRRRD